MTEDNQQFQHLRIAIVAPDASAKFGGEAILPLHYFRHLRKRNIQVWMVLHARTRNELSQVLGADIERIRFIEDTQFDITCSRLANNFFGKVGQLFFGLVLRLYTQIRQKRVLKKLVKEMDINVVHEPSPVSPKFPSLIFNVGAPVVIGPMNGGMSFPPPFQYMEKPLEKYFIHIARSMAFFINLILPGKRLASALLVANQRTARALPVNRDSNVIELVENGVDVEVFDFSEEVAQTSSSSENVKFVYMGRLVGWKALDLLVDVIADMVGSGIEGFELHILGDGVERQNLELQVKERDLEKVIFFHGFKPQKECADFLSRSDALILPSLYECGGAVVLEAMAMAKPVIATKWGGPTDYLDESCGILVDPTTSIDGFKSKMADAIRKLVEDEPLRVNLGKAGRQRIMNHFSWEKKIDAMLQIYTKVTQEKR